MFYHRFSVLSVLLLSVLAAALLVGLNTTLPSPWDDVLVKHKWNAIPNNWVSLGRPPNSATIDLYISLKPNRENALIDALHEVSQPRHPKYGAHLSKEQVAELVAPHPDTLELVTAWLEYHGVPPSSISTTHGGGWLTVTGVSVLQANDLLGASYHLYFHSGTNDTIIRTAGYSLPAALHTHVQTIVPTTAFTSSFPLQQTLRSRPGAAAAGNATTGEPINVLSRRDSSVTPSAIRSMYKTEGFFPTGQAWNALGIVGFENQYPSQIDLSNFILRHRTDARFLPFEVKPINDRVGPPAPGLQSGLGAQYASALTFPTPVIYYQGNTGFIHAPRRLLGRGDRYLEWLNFVINQRNSDIPQTISMAYDSISELTITPEYAESVCLLFGQLGARGVSIFVASGDDGVGRGDCRNNFGHVQFYTGFPASCPLVTSVGGTAGGMESNDPEVANKISGGGFSDIFRLLEFQAPATTAFLGSIGNQHSGLYNPGGRGVPDIAMQSFNYQIILNRLGYHIDSTSCATHTAAALFSLLNDYLISNRRPPLGWLNPWLYDPIVQSLGFNDISTGNNPGCGTLGFLAADGWDPVTGLGSPDFRTLLDLLGLVPP